MWVLASAACRCRLRSRAGQALGCNRESGLDAVTALCHHANAMPSLLRRHAVQGAPSVGGTRSSDYRRSCTVASHGLQGERGQAPG